MRICGNTPKNRHYNQQYLTEFKHSVIEIGPNYFTVRRALKTNKQLSEARNKQATQRGAEQTSNSHQRDAGWVFFRR